MFYEIPVNEYGIDSFEIFAKFVELERLKRAGPLMHGINGEAEARKFASDSNPRFSISHGQSVADHTLEAITLNKIMGIRYYEFIEKDFDHDVCSDADFALWQHDLGEYKYGDIADDGTRPKNTDQKECLILKETLWDKLEDCSWSDWLKSLHNEMENETTNFGVYCKMLDKFSLVLACLCYERQGHGGNTDIKESCFRLSDKDKKAIEFTGSKLTADIFLYSALEGHPKFFEHPCLKAFIQIIQSGAQVVRGHEIEWLHRYLSTK